MTGTHVIPAKGKPHAYEITIENFIKKIPLHLALDSKFLKFYFGDAYIGDPQWFTNECMFPKLCLPNFKFKIFVASRGKELTLTYKCFCHDSFSLFCQSLREYVIPKWVKMIKAMMDHAEKMEPIPKMYVTSYGTLLGESIDPIYGCSLIGSLYKIINDDEVQGKVKINRTGKTVVVRITAKKVPWNAGQAVEQISRFPEQITNKCMLYIEWYPFIRAVCKGTMGTDDE